MVDTRATKHICCDRDVFTSYKAVRDGEKVYMENSNTSSVVGKGKIELKLTSGKILELKDVLHVPEVWRNLISGALLNKAGLKLTFEFDKLVMTKNGVFVGKGYCNWGLFILNVLELIKNVASSSVYLVDSLSMWHGRLGHVGMSYVKKMEQLGLISNLINDETYKCEICVESKHTKKKPIPVERKTELLELIHSDLGDLKNHETRGGKRFYITFIDDYSCFTTLYLLRNKDEAEETFIKYKTEVENQLGKKIKRLRTDRGGEYDSNLFKGYCESYGIIHETTAPYTPESNGVAEHKNRSLKEMTNVMLISSGLHLNMWGEAILSSCHI